MGFWLYLGVAVGSLVLGFVGFTIGYFVTDWLKTWKINKTAPDFTTEAGREKMKDGGNAQIDIKEVVENEREFDKFREFEKLRGYIKTAGRRNPTAQKPGISYGTPGQLPRRDSIPNDINLESASPKRLPEREPERASSRNAESSQGVKLHRPDFI